MANIHIYNGTVTAGGTDGTEISYNGAQTNPITFTLDAPRGGIGTQAIAIRCDSGCKTSGNTVVSFTGENADKWSVCATVNGEYASTLTIPTEIDETNTVIYVRASSVATETPAADTSVQMSVDYVMEKAAGTHLYENIGVLDSVFTSANFSVVSGNAYSKMGTALYYNKNSSTAIPLAKGSAGLSRDFRMDFCVLSTSRVQLYYSGGYILLMISSSNVAAYYYIKSGSKYVSDSNRSIKMDLSGIHTLSTVYTQTRESSSYRNSIALFIDGKVVASATSLGSRDYNLTGVPELIYTGSIYVSNIIYADYDVSEEALGPIADTLLGDTARNIICPDYRYLKYTMLQKRGNLSDWQTQNPVLRPGEIGFVKDENKIKVGDGVTPWNELAYVTSADEILGDDGKVLLELLPEIATGETVTVKSDASRFALTTATVQKGDWVMVTDTGKTFTVVDDSKLNEEAGYAQILTPGNGLQSVNGKTGTVVLTTTSIIEGVNQYYTDARAKAAAQAVSSSELTDGDTIAYDYDELIIDARDVGIR